MHRSRRSPSRLLVPAIFVLTPLSLWGSPLRRTGPQRPKQVQRPNANASDERRTSSETLKITLRSSRPDTTPGDGFEIAADIENISPQPVFFNPLFLTMDPPPEIDPLGPRDWYGTVAGAAADYCLASSNCENLQASQDLQKKIETKQNELDQCLQRSENSVLRRNHCEYLQQQKDLLANERGFDRPIELAAGSKTTVFWNGRKRSGSENWLSSHLSELFTPPGSYPITVVASYWDAKEGAQQKTLDHHSYSTVLTVSIVASQGAVIFGAILGGLIAFFLLPGTRFFQPAEAALHSIPQTILRYISGMLASVLLSIIGTILLSRLADTQFLVKVTVNDFWGAVAIGFVINATGKKLLAKIPGFESQDTLATRRSNRVDNQAGSVGEV